MVTLYYIPNVQPDWRQPREGAAEDPVDGLLLHPHDGGGVFAVALSSPTDNRGLQIRIGGRLGMAHKS